MWRYAILPKPDSTFGFSTPTISRNDKKMGVSLPNCKRLLGNKGLIFLAVDHFLHNQDLSTNGCFRNTLYFAQRFSFSAAFRKQAGAEVELLKSEVNSS